MLRRGFAISLVTLVALMGVVYPTSTASGEAGEKIGRFITYDNGTALDTETQLMWMTKDFRNIEGRAPRTWRESVGWADKINRQHYGGYSDWRVPTTDEYQGVYTPAKPRHTYQGKPVGYPVAFADGGGRWYWTRERMTSGRDGIPLAAYTVDFDTGHLSQKDVHLAGQRLSEPSTSYSSHASVRLVRFAPPGQQRIAVLKSRDLAPFNLAWAGFSVACRPETTPYDAYDLHGSSSDTKGIIDRIIANRHSLVLAIGSLAARVASAEIQDIPIVYVMDTRAHNDRQHSTLITGVSLHIPIATQLATYQSLLPALQTIGVIYDPKKTGAMVVQAEEVAQALGLRLRTASVTSPEEVPAALRRLLGTIDALWMLPDDTVVKSESFKFLALTAFEHKLPLLAFSDAFVEAGALASLSPDYIDMGRQACQLARGTANGHRHPSAVNGVPPEKINLAINLDVARKMGMTIPQEVVDSAHKVYE